MLAWITALMIGVFLVGCAAHIVASCYQLIKLIRQIPRKREPLSRT